MRNNVTKNSDGTFTGYAEHSHSTDVIDFVYCGEVGESRAVVKSKAKQGLQAKLAALDSPKESPQPQPQHVCPAKCPLEPQPQPQPNNRKRMSAASYSRCGMTVCNPRWNSADGDAWLVFTVSTPDGRIERYEATPDQSNWIVKNSHDTELYSRACHYCQCAWDLLN